VVRGVEVVILKKKFTTLMKGRQPAAGRKRVGKSSFFFKRRETAFLLEDGGKGPLLVKEKTCLWGLGRGGGRQRENLANSWGKDDQFIRCGGTPSLTSEEKYIKRERERGQKNCSLTKEKG